MKTLFASILAILIVAVTIIAVGRVAVTPTPAGYHVAIDSDWSDVRRVEEIQRTERARIEAAAAVTIAQEQEATARIVWPAALVAAALAISAVAWSRRPHRPAAPQLLLAYVDAQRRLGHDITVEEVDGEWVAADHRHELLFPVSAIARQLEASRE